MWTAALSCNDDRQGQVTLNLDTRRNDQPSGGYAGSYLQVVI